MCSTSEYTEEERVVACLKGPSNRIQQAVGKGQKLELNRTQIDATKGNKSQQTYPNKSILPRLNLLESHEPLLERFNTKHTPDDDNDC